MSAPVHTHQILKLSTILNSLHYLKGTRRTGFHEHDLILGSILQRLQSFNRLKHIDPHLLSLAAANMCKLSENRPFRVLFLWGPSLQTHTIPIGQLHQAWAGQHPRIEKHGCWPVTRSLLSFLVGVSNRMCRQQGWEGYFTNVFWYNY